jgi:hypothetical protein
MVLPHDFSGPTGFDMPIRSHIQGISGAFAGQTDAIPAALLLGELLLMRP